jgi:hypothetical protein
MILDFLPRKKLDAIRPALTWALGRVGARVPVYGPLNCVVPPDVADAWIGRLIKDGDIGDTVTHMALMQLSRRTGDRYRDVSESIRADVIDELTAEDARTHLVELVREVGRLETDEQSLIFGESLPSGLRIP